MEYWQNQINRLIDFIERFPSTLRKFKEKYQLRILFFLFFVFVSFILWFIRALNERYESEISYPVRYTQLPENKILAEKLPDNLLLKVEAPGLKILMRQLKFNINALRFNVESFSRSDTGKNSFYILTNQVKEYVEEDLEDIRILNISPDSIHFQFIDVVSRKKPVLVQLKNPDRLLSKQYALNGEIHTIPDSIDVKGPASVLDTLHFLFTLPVDLKNLNDSVIRNVQVQPVDQIEIGQTKIKIVIPVDKYTESSVTLPIVAINVPDTVYLKTFPASATITYSITMSNYEKVNSEMLMPYVNYFNVNNTSNRLFVALIDTPVWIYNVRISPGMVDFIIER